MDDDDDESESKKEGGNCNVNKIFFTLEFLKRICHYHNEMKIDYLQLLEKKLKKSFPDS